MLQVMREQEGREMPHRVTAIESVEPDATEDKAGMAFGFDDDATDDVMPSLEAFKG